MKGILAFIGGVPPSKSRSDDDAIDRLHHRYTVAVLVIFSIVVSSKQYVGDRINCWVPAHFSKSWTAYAESYCWVKNTYYLPFEEYIPKQHEEREMITYYQWIPLILLVQAFIFYIPCIVWRNYNNRTGIDLNNMIVTGQIYQYVEHIDAKDKTLLYMTKQMNRYLTSQREYRTEWTVSLKNCISRVCCMFCGRQKGNYLVVLYLFVKLLFIANVILQLFALNYFLGFAFNFFGIDVMESVSRGEDWTQTSRFPRVTMCDIEVRRLGNLQRYSFQCALPINLFNEKIYLFIWFWFVLVAIVTCISFLVWFLRIAVESDCIRYVKKHLLLYNRIESDDDKDDARVKRFVRDYLRQDGVFIMRLMGHNTNAVTVTEFVCSLWDFWCKNLNETVAPL